MNGYSQDTTQWYWNHSIGLNRNFEEISTQNGDEYIDKHGINLKSNWKRISPKKWIFSLGFNFKNERYKTKDYVLLRYNPVMGRADTMGTYSYHYSANFYFLNFGFGKNIEINENWRMIFEMGLYAGGFEKYKEQRKDDTYYSDGNNRHVMDSYLNVNLFLGSSVEVFLQRKIKGRNFVFLSLQYDNKIASILDRRFTHYVNVNFGISTLLLPDKTGFPYKSKMKTRYQQAALTKNAIIVELFGSGFLYSINYERNLVRRDRYNLLGRVGFSYWDDTMINFGLSNVFGKRNFRFETGVYYNQGFFKYWDGRQGYDYMIFPFAGIRKDKRKHYLFRMGVSPFFDFKGWDWYMSGYLSFGYRF